MTTFESAAAAMGMVSGAAVVVLALAQLTCEHAEGHFLPRLTTIALGILSGWTAVDCWEVWAGTDDTLDLMGVGFCCALALSWGYRRTMGVTSLGRPPKVAPPPIASRR